MIATAVVLCFSLNTLPQQTDTADSSEADVQPTSLILTSDSTASSTPPAENPKNLVTQEKRTPQETPFPGERHFPQFGYSSQLSAAAIESLMIAHPGMRRTILKELLMPTGPPAYLASIARQRDLLHQIDSLSRMTPFELMGSRAKRYQEVYENPIDKRMLLPQADIFGFIRWLAELIK
jgi:hypothetical protein